MSGKADPKSTGTWRRGELAEQLVAEWLTRQGFSVVARNLRISYFELDIVARNGPLVVVVEVRQRASSSFTTGFGSINQAKRRRVRWAAERLWARRYANDSTVERLRLDAASIVFGTTGVKLEYCAGAF